MFNGLIKKEAETPATVQSQSRPQPVYRPAVDILENDQGLTLLADMPGVNDKGIDIELNGHNLMIRGKVAEADLPAGTPVHAEFRPGGYERSFTLGDSIDRDHIRAVMKDGVLRLTLPKVGNAQARKIKVDFE